jgi:hypothetical protein
VRTVIVHYHMFKNAGTSIDFALQAAFGERWSTYEGLGPTVSPEELGAFVVDRPELVAVSSHRAQLPPPELKGTLVIPIVMLRHPLDRIRSAYSFERVQEADTPGARAAKELDIRRYVIWRLERPGDRTARSFQTWRLARAGAGRSELTRALNSIQRLPIVGLVEAYEASLEILGEVLRPAFPDIELTTISMNPTADAPATMLARLRAMRSELGRDLYGELRRRNYDDLALWRAVKTRYRNLSLHVGQGLAEPRTG